MILKLHNPQLIGTYVTDDTFELTTLCIQIHQMLANFENIWTVHRINPMPSPVESNSNGITNKLQKSIALKEITFKIAIYQ